MKRRAIALIFLCLFALAAGCAPPPQPDQWPETPALSHLDISQKKKYIQSTKQSLKNYRQLAEDLSQRQKPESYALLGGEADKFIHMYVVPIIEDAEASSHIETKLEIAKLQLISGYTYAELGMEQQAGQLLARMSDSFGKDLSIMNATLGEPDLGYATIGAGVDSLKQKISGK